jgi:hypothetical protein
MTGKKGKPGEAGWKRGEEELQREEEAVRDTVRGHRKAVRIKECHPPSPFSAPCWSRSHANLLFCSLIISVT